MWHLSSEQLITLSLQACLKVWTESVYASTGDKFDLYSIKHWKESVMVTQQSTTGSVRFRISRPSRIFSMAVVSKWTLYFYCDYAKSFAIPHSASLHLFWIIFLCIFACILQPALLAAGSWTCKFVSSGSLSHELRGTALRQPGPKRELRHICKVRITLLFWSSLGRFQCFINKSIPSFLAIN